MSGPSNVRTSHSSCPSFQDESIIKRIFLDHVLENDKILYNTNNHPYSEEMHLPPDYFLKQELTRTKKWINKFHKDYPTLTFDKQDISWMKKALQIGYHTGKFSDIYEDELEQTVQKYKDINLNQGFFIRSDKVSLKEGQNGIGPYHNIKSIIESMCSTTPGHSAFDLNDETCTIYFLPWLKFNPDKEFRVFVHNNEITAISAQHLYTINNWLNTLSDKDIAKVINNIQSFFNDNIKDKLAYLTDYTYDFVFLDDGNSFDNGYFIECNGFGRHYAAGSALYHWIYDHDTLHDSSVIELRYVSEY